MIEAADEVIVVTDHTKIGGISLHKVADVNKINHLVTGSEVSELQLQLFKEAGIRVSTA